MIKFKSDGLGYTVLRDGTPIGYVERRRGGWWRWQALKRGARRRLVVSQPS